MLITIERMIGSRYSHISIESESAESWDHMDVEVILLNPPFWVQAAVNPVAALVNVPDDVWGWWSWGRALQSLEVHLGPGGHVHCDRVARVGHQVRLCDVDAGLLCCVDLHFPNKILTLWSSKSVYSNSWYLSYLNRDTGVPSGLLSVTVHFQVPVSLACGLVMVRPHMSSLTEYESLSVSYWVYGLSRGLP